MKKTSKLNKVGILAFAAALALSNTACQKKGEGARQAGPSEVVVVKPVKKNVEIWDEYTARVEAYEFVEVRARVGGYLEKICFTEGQEVKAGDVLFVIDQRPYEAALDAAKAAMKEVEARLQLAKSNFDRSKELYAAKAVSKEVHETRNAELLSAEAELLNAKAKLRDAELNLEFTEVKAPIPGRVSQRLIDVGNLINANSSLLTTIVRSDIVQAYFEIAERDVMRYKLNGLFNRINILERKGPPVTMTLLGENHEPFKGVLNYYDNRVGTETSSLTLRADFDNKDGMLTPGLFGKLKLLVNESQEVVLLPEDIIGTDLVNRYVLVVNDDNVVEYRALQIGRLIGKYRIIEGGLKGGERVISKGLMRVMPGVKVVATEEAIAD